MDLFQPQNGVNNHPLIGKAFQDLEEGEKQLRKVAQEAGYGLKVLDKRPNPIDPQRVIYACLKAGKYRESKSIKDTHEKKRRKTSRRP